MFFLLFLSRQLNFCKLLHLLLTMLGPQMLATLSNFLMAIILLHLAWSATYGFVYFMSYTCIQEHVIFI